MAHFASVLDGETLWLAVSGDLDNERSLALFDTVTGELHLLPCTFREDHQQNMLVSRAILYGKGAVITPRSGALLALVVCRTHVSAGVTGGDPGEAVRHCSRALGETPTKTPPTSDHRWLFEVAEGPLGTVQLECREVEPAALVERVSVTGDALVVVLKLPRAHPVSPRLCLVSDAGEPLFNTHLIEDGTDHIASLRRDVDLQPGAVGRCFVQCGDHDKLIPVARKHNDLVEPNRAVQLPSLTWVRPGHVARSLRLRYRDSGALVVRCVETGEDTA